MTKAWRPPDRVTGFARWNCFASIASETSVEGAGARLSGIRERKTIGGPGGSKTTKGGFVTFDLEVTNRTDAPATVAEGQFILYLREIHLEAVEVEEDFEPRSFLARDRAISSVSIYEPEGLFSEPGYGVIRTYQ